MKLYSLERRRVKRDLIEILKSVKGFNEGDVGKVLTISSQDRTRNNGFKLEKNVDLINNCAIWPLLPGPFPLPHYNCNK